MIELSRKSGEVNYRREGTGKEVAFGADEAESHLKIHFRQFADTRQI